MMSRRTGVLLVGLLAAISTPVPRPAAASSSAIPPGLEFLSPVPGSTAILPGTNVIVRPGGVLDPASVDPGLLRVEGSSSGSHEGQLRLSDDLRTLTFQPDAPFAFGEGVTAALGAGLRTDKGKAIPPVSFGFTISGPEREALAYLPYVAETDDERRPSSRCLRISRTSRLRCSGPRPPGGSF